MKFFKDFQFLQDFKAFAIKGNVIDLAVWVIIGTAFGKIVSSLVADVITPLLGLFTGGVDLTKFTYVHKNLISWAEVTVRYGQFLQSVFDFLIVSFSIFLFVSFVNKAISQIKKEQKKEEEKKISEEILILGEIRDLLAGKSVGKPVTKKKSS